MSWTSYDVQNSVITLIFLYLINYLTNHSIAPWPCPTVNLSSFHIHGISDGLRTGCTCPLGYAGTGIGPSGCIPVGQAGGCASNPCHNGGICQVSKARSLSLSLFFPLSLNFSSISPNLLSFNFPLSLPPSLPLSNMPGEQSSLTLSLSFFPRSLPLFSISPNLLSLNLFPSLSSPPLSSFPLFPLYTTLSPPFSLTLSLFLTLPLSFLLYLSLFFFTGKLFRILLC